MSSTSEQFEENKISGINELFIQFNTDSCCEDITGGVNIYLYGCVSLLAHECPMCVCVCVISNQSIARKPH